MFTLVYGDDLFQFPNVANQMFRARRSQFADDYGWELDIDDLGREIDEYDLMNPLYLILRDKEGKHVGSTRLMPTTGPTMIADHFADLTDGVQIESPTIWECTRFFIADRGQDSVRNAAAIMWAGCQLALRSGVEFYVGITGAHMTRVFAACGWPAEIIGERKDEKDGHLVACLWEVNQELCDRLARRARIDQGEYDLAIFQRPAPDSAEIEVPQVPAEIASGFPHAIPDSCWAQTETPRMM
ncbi:MAG: acyl-homoserine-lactone synthase [Paracoccaceae bacterium]